MEVLCVFIACFNMALVAYHTAILRLIIIFIRDSQSRLMCGQKKVEA